MIPPTLPIRPLVFKFRGRIPRRASSPEQSSTRQSPASSAAPQSNCINGPEERKKRSVSLKLKAQSRNATAIYLAARCLRPSIAHLEAFTMERHGRANLTEAVRLVQLLKIDGHEWEVHLYPKYYQSFDQHWVVLKLILLSEPQSNKLVNLSCRLVGPTLKPLHPSAEISFSHSHVFGRSGECTSNLFLARRRDVESLGYLIDDSLTVQCTLTVLKELPDIVIPVPAANVEVPLPPSDLHRHLGELLQGQRGADVTFVLDSGDCFPAHKNILAARSPVFMAQFLGDMDERRSQSVRIQDMQAGIFKSMLHFIYTDMVPELDVEPNATMAQHLLAAADRYGLDRLKLICEGKLSGGIDVHTAATTLALAEQHNCSLLKSKCVEFIARSPETLEAVLASDGYRHLVQSCPMVLAELLTAARGRRN